MPDSRERPQLLDSGFWQQPEITRAVALRNFGYLLRAYRDLHQPPIRQAELAAWLGVTQAQISRVERGVSAGQSLDRLSEWAITLRIPQAILWFELRESTGADTEPDLPSDSESDDVNRRQVLRAAGVGAVLLATDASGGTSTPMAASGRVDAREIESLRYWTTTFRHADNRFGGGETLTQTRQYLSSQAAPMLRRARLNAKARRELLSAAAELYQLAGWMSYDTGDAEAGRAYLRQALRLSEDINDRTLAAEMLAAMSHHAAFLRSAHEAVDFALAARSTAMQTGQPALLAEAAAMEAHGLALQGNTRAALAALREAERQFARVRTGNLPEWLGYLDQAYLSAKFGHTLRDLKMPDEAEPFARQSLRMSEGYDRGRMFNTALLAGVLADRGQVDEAVAVAQDALTLASGVRSRRAEAYLTDVAHRLRDHANDPRVRTLYKGLAARQIPVARVG